MSWILPLQSKRQIARHPCGTPNVSRPVEFDGQTYPSITAAAKAIGRAHTSIFHRLKRGTARYV